MYNTIKDHVFEDKNRKQYRQHLCVSKLMIGRVKAITPYECTCTYTETDVDTNIKYEYKYISSENKVFGTLLMPEKPETLITYPSKAIC